MSTFEVHNIRLEPPNISYQGSYLSAMAEFQGDSEKSAWIYLGEDEPHDTPAKDFASYVSRLRSVEATAPPNFVRSTCNWALKTGKPTKGEWRVVWPDGSVHWIAGRWQVFMNESGGPSRMIGVNIEITDRKRAEEALLGMSRKLIEAHEQERTRIGRAKNGGAFESIVPNGDKPKKKRFWIDLLGNSRGV